MLDQYPYLPRESSCGIDPLVHSAYIHRLRHMAVALLGFYRNVVIHNYERK